MKTHFLTGLILSIATSHALAGAPGNSGGGGGCIQTSNARIMKELENNNPRLLLRSLEEIAIELQQPKDSIFYIADPILRKIFSQMIGSGGNGRPLALDIENTKVNIKTNGACQDGNHAQKAMSVKENKFGSELCVSIPELAKIPDTTFELSRHIHALYFHEFTHHLGYGEDEAELVQNFILKKFMGEMYPSYAGCQIDLYLEDKDNGVYSRIKLFPKSSGWSFGPANGNTGLLGQNMETEMEINVETPKSRNKRTDSVNIKTLNETGDFALQVSKEKSKVKFMVLDKDYKRKTIEVSWGKLDAPPVNGSKWFSTGNSAEIRSSGLFDGQTVNVKSVGVKSSCFYE